MAEYIDDLLQRQKQLADDIKFCARSRTLSAFERWSLQRLITLDAYGGEMPKETREAIRIAKQRAEIIDSPADRSAATAAAALTIAQRTAENAVKQRYVTTASAIVSAMISLLALVVAAYAAFKPEKKAELSQEQLQTLRLEVLADRAVIATRPAQPAGHPSLHQPVWSENPFLPKRK